MRGSTSLDFDLSVTARADAPRERRRSRWATRALASPSTRRTASSRCARAAACVCRPRRRFEPDATLAWEAVRERLRYAAGRAFEPANEFVHASPYVPPLAALRDWRGLAFTPGRPVAEAAST